MQRKNKALRDSYKTMRCLICGTSPCDPCHIKTYGSGGLDDESNLLNLCRKHHSESHNLGWGFFCIKYSIVELELIKKGWKLENIFGVRKLFRN